MPCPRNSAKKIKKVAFEVIDCRSFMTYIMEGYI